MVKDLIYIFDKITKKRTLLGEIQTDFNISFTIDGTKDSCAVLVYSFSDIEIEPYTIVYHEKTSTWWIVSHDKVERYMNEDNTFVYIHSIELLGAIELLNARDLIDCGFNDNTYTVSQVIERLFSLSNMEYPLLFDSRINQNFLNKNVNFIKTFENYTLLSALREFLNAYNMCAQLVFDTTIVNYETILYYARLKIIPKTGDSTLPAHIIEDFNDARETKTIDKDSFGTCVVSNAENVISSRAKTFPAVGTTLLSSTELTISSSNAVIRLPSKVFKGNWLKMAFKYHGYIYLDGTIVSSQSPDHNIFPYNSSSFNVLKTWIIGIINGHSSYSSDVKNGLINKLNDNWESIVDTLNKAGTITLYDGNKLVPTFTNNSSTVAIEKGNNVPYLAQVEEGTGVNAKVRKLVFCDKETRELLPLKAEGIAWERGSDLITGFDIINRDIYLQDLSYTDRMDSSYHLFEIEYDGHSVRMDFQSGTSNHIYLKGNILEKYFIVNYIPMDDIKIKVDNQRTKKDINVYNQNGKITDNFALSKLLNSYSKEISSDNIVRYAQYTNYDDVPKVGSIVYTENGIYVINNISMTFTQNETENINSFNYFIDCEINMSKWISTKSLMVNPNSNIRDYGIPQNYNVKRKQLYRDYYELNYTYNEDRENEYYLDPQNIFYYGHNPTKLDNFVAVIKLTYTEQIGTPASSSWYYQLETTNYYMNKMLYVFLDFKDNNIIGYGSQNIFSGFDPGRIFSGLTDTINTPIQYTDDDGKVLGIDILFLNNEQITNIYNYYLEKYEHEDTDVSMYNYSVFIPSDIYDDTLTYETYEMRITEENYKKDALEVPVFEYACQIDDSDDVLIGDDILIQHDGNVVYFYSFVKGINLTQDSVAATGHVTEKTSSPLGWILNNGASIEYESISNSEKQLNVTIYLNQFLDLNDMSWNNQNQLDFDKGYDYAIFRHSYNLSTKEEIIDLILIAKLVPQAAISSDGKVLKLKLNHYKLN